MLTAVLVVLLGLVALLAIPVTVQFRVASPAAIDNDIRLQWAFGLVRARIPTGPQPDQAAKNLPGRKRSSKDKPEQKRSSRKKRNVFAAIRLKRFRRRIFRFIRDLWRAIHKQNIRLHLRIGLGDPADTGRLWSVLGPVSGWLADIRDASINVEPEFMDMAFELDSSGRVRVIPLQVLYLAVGLLVSPAVWQGLRQMRAEG